MEDITIEDFNNPWNFFHLFNQSDEVVMNWCVRNGLIASQLQCPTCGGQMNLAQRGFKTTGFSFRCKSNRSHAVASRKFSFFEGFKLTIQDIMVFVKSYLEGHTLFMTSRMSGVSYRSAGVDWGSFIRELFKDHFTRSIRHKVLKGNENINLKNNNNNINNNI